MLTSDEEKVVEAESAKLVKKNVISQRDHVVDEYVSTIFLRPKKDGSHRLILNLKHLTSPLKRYILNWIRLRLQISCRKKDCHFASLHIRDAYYSIPVNESCKKFFTFCFQDNLLIYLMTL